MVHSIVEAVRCRLCESPALIPIISLGNQYVVDFVDSNDAEQVRAPLDLVLCDPSAGGCSLLQLKHTFSKDKLYRYYWYRSGMNKTMTDELQGMARLAEQMVHLRPGDAVIDIGSNDSTLLRGYATPNITTVGFEPARNIATQYGLEGVSKVILDYFNYPAWQREFGNRKARVVSAIAMFYDLDNPNSFVADIASCLAPDGVCLVQQNSLPAMIERNVFDNISHEHVCYYSLTTFMKLLNRHGLEVFDVEENNVNGGSMRAFIRHAGSATAPQSAGGADRVRALLEKEAGLGLDRKETYVAFADRITAIKEKLRTFLQGEIAKGKTVYAYGASTRGNVMLQFCDLDHRVITAAAERNPDKWGKKTVGTLVPIISEADARLARPDYFLVLPWQFLDEFIKRESEHFMRGGKFVVAMPDFRVIHGSEGV